MANSVIALFCEDVRQEQMGQHSLIGILPDNIRVPSVPGRMAKLGLYIRAIIDSSSLPQQTTIRVTNTNGQHVPVSQWDQTIIQAGYSDANSRGLPVYGLISTAVFGSFHIPQEGTVQVTVNIDGTDYVAGVLHFSTSATASPPPIGPVQPVVPASS